MIQSSQIRACDVCRLLDWDTSKKVCTYCSLCDAFICEQDKSRWDRRLRAAAKRKLEFGYKGIDNYEQLIREERNDLSTDFGKPA